jgi:hypothetical protein
MIRDFLKIAFKKLTGKYITIILKFYSGLSYMDFRLSILFCPTDAPSSVSAFGLTLL